MSTEFAFQDWWAKFSRFAGNMEKFYAPTKKAFWDGAESRQPEIDTLHQRVRELTEQSARLLTEKVEANDALRYQMKVVIEDAATGEEYARLQRIEQAALAILSCAGGDAPWLRTAEFDELRAAVESRP